MQSANLFNLNLQPTLNKYLNIFASYINLSDGNRSWEVIVHPSMAVIRRDTLKIDLGLSGNWYSFENRLSNGYYSPKLAQLYLATIDLYYGIKTTSAFSLTSGLGSVKDETMSKYYLAGDINLKYVYGIFKDWQIALQGGFSYRGNPTSPYTIKTVSFVLTRRLN
jgi:hypothetical protein